MELLLLLCHVVAVSGSCCLPDVFQTAYHYTAAVTQGSGKDPSVTRHHLDMWYDYQTKKDATMWTQVHVDNPSTYKRINDYTKGKYYEIHNVGTEHENCTEHDGPTTMDRMCLPAEAEMVGMLYYGTGGTKIEAERYRFRNDLDAVTFYFNVMPHTCVFIDRVEYQGPIPEQEHDYAMAGGTYLDFLPEVADRDELEPPEHCTPAQNTKEPSLSATYVITTSRKNLTS